ncbi:UNVERIFIED_CONTAM: hypothetical protein FKN15_023712 [Acipenser sinensis]
MQRVTQSPVQRITEPSSTSHTEPSSTSHTEPSARSHTEPSATSHTEPSATSHTEPSVRSHIEPSATSHTEPSARSPTEPSARSHTESSATSHTEPSARSHTEPSARSYTEPGAMSHTESSARSHTEPSATSPTEPSARSHTEPSATSHTEPSAMSPTEPSARSPTEPSATSPTEPSARSHTEPSAMSPTEPSARSPTEPSATSPTEPSARSHTAQCKESHRAQCNESHRVQCKESHRAQCNESHRVQCKESHRAQCKESHRGKEEVYFVVLTKEEGSGLGFSIAGGVDLEQKCVTVHRVFSRGIAGLEGTIQRGDNIISISGTPLGGASHGDALSVLHQARLPKQALVVIRRGKESEPLSPRQEVSASGGRRSQSTRDVTMETGTGPAVDLGDAISVELQKTSAGLGFSLDGGKASVHGDRPLYIKRIFKGTLLCQNRNSTLNDVSLVYLLLVVEIKTKRGFRGSRVTHPVKVLLLECRMHPIAWTSAVQVQAIPLPAVDGSSQGMEHNWPSTARGAGRA